MMNADRARNRVTCCNGGGAKKRNKRLQLAALEVFVTHALQQVRLELPRTSQKRDFKLFFHRRNVNDRDKLRNRR